MQWPDTRVPNGSGQLQTREVSRTSLTATSVQVAVGNGSRVRLILSITVDDPAVPSFVVIQTALGVGANALCVLSNDHPHAVLCLEEYGDAVFSEIVARSPIQGAILSVREVVWHPFGGG